MASSSSQTSYSTNDFVRLGCTRLNDNVYELYRPPSGPINIQIVFFHGFQTRGSEDAFIRTWMTRDGSKCWLNTWLVESIPQAHILSVSYDSSTRTSHSEGRQDMYLIGENLAHILAEILEVGWNCPVVLVGHCVGGLVLKEVCLKASQMMQEEGLSVRHRKFLANLRGMFFYATAHLGSHIPLTATANLIQLQGGPLLTYLHLLSTSSIRINEDFRKLRRRYNWMTYGVMEANKTKTVMLMQFFDHDILPGLDSAATSEYQMVVEEGSSRYDLDSFSFISDVDHFNISNPKDQYSNSFVHLINFLKQLLEQEDETNRDLERRLQLDSNWIWFDERIRDVIQHLDLQNPDPKALSIVGMDGIGKSTLVKQILVRIQRQFDFVCFLEFENVPQKQKWRDFEKLVAENLYRGSGKRVSSEMDAPWSLLKGKKVLIIVDDVEDENQINSFKDFNWFGEGSRLIITTCNKSLSQFMAFIEFEVPLLSKQDSQKLFRVHVDNFLLRRISRELVSQIVDECDGLPLALQLVGRYLSKKEKEVTWISVMGKMRSRTTKALDGYGENRIWKWFKVIFDELDQTEQKIFLDLATFDVHSLEKTQYDLNILKVAWRTGLGSDGKFIDPEVKNLKDRYLDHDMAIDPDMVIENLRDRCLLRIDRSTQNTIRVQTEMDAQFSHIYIHKLLRNIGRWLSRLVNEEVDLQHGRGLWELQQIKDVLNETKGEAVAQRNKKLEILSVAMESTCSDSFIKWSSISRFEKLRLLRMSNVDMTRGSDEFILRLPQSLAMLHMIDCSGPQPRRFSWWQPDWPIRVEEVECLCRLSVLLLDNCNSIRLPKNIHQLQNLRILQIHDSTKTAIIKLPETLGFLPTLEHLSLSAQVERLPDSLLELRSLKSMKLSSSSILKSWPMPAKVDTSCHLSCLTSLELSILPALAHLPDSFGELKSLKKLSLDLCSALERLPEGFSALQQLTKLSIGRCKRLETLCESFPSLSRLQDLILRKLPALRRLPGNVGNLPSLEVLYIVECSYLEELPESVTDLQLLKVFSIQKCDSLVSLWQDPPGHCHLTRGLKRLWHLTIEECHKLQGLPESIGQLSGLLTMLLMNCRQLECLPGSLMQIASLEILHIHECKNLSQLLDFSSQLSKLNELDIIECSNLRIRLPIGGLKSLHTVRLYQSPSPLTPPETLGIEVWQNFSESVGQLMRLQELSLTSSQWLVSLPESLGQLTSLERLNIVDCRNLYRLPDSLGQLLSLKELHIQDCRNLHHLPDSLGQVSSLKTLAVVYCENFLELPESICHLRRLEHLFLNDCGRCERLPQRIGDLESLTHLELKDCGVMEPEDFAVSLGRLRKLRSLGLPPCRSSRDSVIKAITESLKELNVLESLSITSSAENFEVIFESLWQFTSLQWLYVSHVDYLECLPESVMHLSQLRQLSLESCQNLKELPKTLGELAALQNLKIQDCDVLKTLPESIGRLKGLQKLSIERCDSFKHLPDSMLQLKLKKLSILQCKSLDLKQLPSSLLAVLSTD